MRLRRRQFLLGGGLALAGGALAGAPRLPGLAASARLQVGDWDAVRDLFPLTRDYLHFGGNLLASHPAPVQAAIDGHRRALNEDPVHYLHEQQSRLEQAVLAEAAAYLGVDAGEIALTDSTTMGLALLYNGLEVRADQELLTSEHDFWATHESLRLKAERSGAALRRVRLYDRPQEAGADQIAERLVQAVSPRTRVVALTWVHSSTGVKLPIRQLADALAPLNRERAEADRALLCVDGVHGFGVEDVTMADLGCDAFAAGCHKWLFGPRGTGLVWARPTVWAASSPTIPTFSGGRSPGPLFTPGGFHSFEHRWALAQAFELHQQLGKAQVAARIHDLNRQFKDGLAQMGHVTLYTPRDDALSCGLICFDVQGLTPAQVEDQLRQRRVISTETPYDPSYARVAPGLLNSPAEVDQALAAIRALA